MKNTSMVQERLSIIETATVKQKLLACIQTRQTAASVFHTTLSGLLSSGQPISEADFRNAWLTEMRVDFRIYPEGWYMPPPHGIGVLFGTETDYKRMNYQSLRPDASHPRKDIFLDKEKGVVYVYASPVDRSTGMIGDWGMTIYFGKNPDIIKHLQQCLYLNRQVLEHAQIGMSFVDLTKYTADLFSQQGLSNQITSTTDIAGVNIGHTVPASYEEWTPEELQVFAANDWQRILTMISKKRKFLSTQEPLEIRPGMAFTIEQRLTRLSSPAIPMSSFHTIALFHTNGEKELLTNFDDVFRLTGMHYMLNIN